MRGHRLVVTAARVAKVFRLDPVDVLDSEPFEWMLRIACYEVIAEDMEKANREQERRSKR